MKNRFKVKLKTGVFKGMDTSTVKSINQLVNSPRNTLTSTGNALSEKKGAIKKNPVNLVKIHIHARNFSSRKLNMVSKNHTPSIFFMFSSKGGLITPFSVIIAVMRVFSVTSKAGFRTFTPSGAILFPPQ